MFKVEEVNKINEFFELGSIWNRLLSKSRDDNPFLTWEYLSTYWKHFGKNAKLRVLCAKDRDEIIAIAPLRQSHFNFADLFGYSVIEPLGYRGLMQVGADYTGLLLGERETECLSLFLKYLKEHYDWDFSPIQRFELTKGAICPYIMLPKSMDIFLGRLDGKFRKNLRRCMRQLVRDCDKVEFKKYDQLDSVKHAMEILSNYTKKDGFQNRCPAGVFNTQTIRDFYLDVTRKFADNGWFALYFLTVNDEPIAAHYCFEYEQKSTSL